MNPLLFLVGASRPRIATPSTPVVGGRGTSAERAAGIASLSTGTEPPTSLPAVADFSITGTASNAAYFLVTNPGRTPRVADLVTASAAQVLHDIREELGVTTVPRTYSRELLEAARGRAEGFAGALPEVQRPVIPELPTIPLTGAAALPVRWMNLLLWITYFPDVAPSALLMGQNWKMPDMLSDVFPDAFGRAVAYPDFRDGSLRLNPFVYRNPDIDVVGSLGDGGSSGGGLLLGLLLLGGLAVAGSDK